jgi:hypothetical protein
MQPTSDTFMASQEQLNYPSPQSKEDQRKKQLELMHKQMHIYKQQ